MYDNMREIQQNLGTASNRKMDNYFWNQYLHVYLYIYREGRDMQT